MKILVTNDDGYSEGLRMLLEAARMHGDAYAIVPGRQRSAVGGALTLHKPLRLHRREGDIFELNGTPADCVLFSCYSEDFGKPELVLSGINWGDNAGLVPLIGSGTLGACWQAAFEGVPAVAFSRYTTHRDWRNREAWGDQKLMVRRAGEVLDLLMDRLEPDGFYSVNMPEDLRASEVVFTQSMQKRRFETHIVKRLDPNGVPYYWVDGKPLGCEEGTDLYEIAKNKNIAVTKISLRCFED